ncbi:MAG TPA: hypothetical protein PLS67_07830 [Accumulibacter sp.]|nr:hypothetical protein [Accumulibacter sp.]HQC80417.1 hypothetical protein [Accumulibacter sp.]
MLTVLATLVQRIDSRSVGRVVVGKARHVIFRERRRRTRIEALLDVIADDNDFYDFFTRDALEWSAFIRRQA